MPTALTIASTILLALTELMVPAAHAGQLEPITPRDCVTVRRIPDDRLSSPIQINPQHTRVAYLVNSPNLTTNQNDVQLYVRDLKGGTEGENVPVSTGTEMHDLHWLGDGTHLSVLTRDRGNLVIALVDVIRKSRMVVARLKDADIQEYSIDSPGKTVVFAANAGNSNTIELTHADIEKGYLIHPNPPSDTRYHQAHLFVVSRTGRSEWSRPIRLSLTSPLTHEPIQFLSYLISLHLSLSPDGKSLLFSFVDSEHIPSAWLKNPIVAFFKSRGVPLEMISQYKLTTHQTSLSFASSFVYQTPVWNADSSSYAVVATEAVNEAPAGNRTGDVAGLPPPHVYSVSGRSGIAEEVMPASAVAPDILSTDCNEGVLLRSGAAKIVRIRREGSRWVEQSSVTIPVPTPRSLIYGPLASDGEHVVGDYEDAGTPPEVYSYSAGNASIQVLARLNPQFDHLDIAPTRPISWQTSDGYPLQGTLWLPPNYTEGVKYPLVIQTKPDAGDFACDSGGNHDPAFAPQPTANAGMIYIARTWPQDYKLSDDAAHYPKGYPGGISEAAFHMDIWDSAVRALVAKGMVDPAKIGIIGFSRAGWYTEFILTHSEVHYRAATAADNILYSLGDYWLHQTERSVLDGELIYGGPPYGPSLDNWLKYSISFNLNKVHTPLLVEVFGEGVPYSPGKAIPDVLAPSFEVVTGLTRLNKPVALYYYPNDVHQPNNPQSRLGSLQRNLDWYCFWLQGIERTGQEVAAQYFEWRRLKELDLNSTSLQPRGAPAGTPNEYHAK